MLPAFTFGVAAESRANNLFCNSLALHRIFYNAFRACFQCFALHRIQTELPSATGLLAHVVASMRQTTDITTKNIEIFWQHSWYVRFSEFSLSLNPFCRISSGFFAL